MGTASSGACSVGSAGAVVLSFNSGPVEWLAAAVRRNTCAWRRMPAARA
jgi:hypothetical protein